MEEAIRNNANGSRPVTSLNNAIRAARIEAVEHSQVVAELRGAEMARLEMLKDAIAPVLAQVPQGLDLFDTGIVPGEHPRLFIDMIGFVEMGRDRRTYRLVQDTRHGRVVMAESDKLDVIEGAVANYMARRIIERERALASDATLPSPTRPWPGPEAPAPDIVKNISPALSTHTPVAAASAVRPPRKRRRIHGVMRFIIQFLGAFTLCVVLITAVLAAIYIGYPVARIWLAAHFGWPEI